MLLRSLLFDFTFTLQCSRHGVHVVRH
uniref:Uncharacterized protein n=1 Tax=Rhizophora mucronata TaxID=61149 RepID=A0A2P2KFY6_RHIMU